MTPPLAIIGLGNPGKEYEHTRHNAGFMAIDQLAKDWHKEHFKIRKSVCEHALIHRNGLSLLLAKPLTFMNQSGQAVSWIQQFYKPSGIVVIYDDIALPLGSIRIRKKGSAGGHNGIKSIIEHIGQEFIRIRIGIASPHPVSSLHDYVLAPFSREDRVLLEPCLKQIPAVVETLITQGVDHAMNCYN